MEKVLNKLNLGGEQETYRQAILAKDMIERALRNEVYELQRQLQSAYIRIKELKTELDNKEIDK